MKIIPIPLGKGFDTSDYVSPDQAKALVKAGYKYAIRYVRRDQHVNTQPDTQWPISLSVAELHGLLDAGLAVGLVQFGRFHGRNYLSASAGAEHGYAAAYNARHLGIPEGITVYVDAEWTDRPDRATALLYLRKWGQAASDARVRAGCYRAFDRFTGADWYSLPYYRTYWASAMHDCLRQPPLPRGDAVYQHTQITDCGVPLDPCYSVADHRGDRPRFVVA